ncbi:hypothetical protein QUF72_20050, partial [Desulfobacterales bacterium HSG2]|nr:hypothetical protein [Desulfobacterales bacterium HSG2]
RLFDDRGVCIKVAIPSHLPKEQVTGTLMLGTVHVYIKVAIPSHLPKEQVTGYLTLGAFVSKSQSLLISRRSRSQAI